MLTAIRTILITGSITNVIPRGQNVVNPTSPYVVIWYGKPLQQSGQDKAGTDRYFINTHFPKGYINQIEDYVFNELITLLPDKILLTTRDGRTVILYTTMEIGDIIEGNSDGTISKERLFVTAGLY